MGSIRPVSASKTLLSVFAWPFWHVLCSGASGAVACPAGHSPCQIGSRFAGMGATWAAKKRTKGKFRHLDSNQDNRLQRTVGCQLPHAGQKPQVAAAAAASTTTTV